MSGRCQVTVDADLDAVWDVVRDVTRVGEWSHECVGVAWLDGATAATPGARFRGRNKQGIFRWGRVCEIVTRRRHTNWCGAPSPRRCTPTAPSGGSGSEQAGNRTEIEQSFTVVRGPKLLALAFGFLLPAHRDRTASLTGDLRRLGDLAVRRTSELHTR